MSKPLPQQRTFIVQQPGYWFESFVRPGVAHGLGDPPATDARAPLWSHFTRWIKGESR
jgi:hypothetical protein